MPKLFLSVRAKLLGVCVGLLIVFGGSSLLLGYLIYRNQADQRAIQEQYRRFEVIQAVWQAMGEYRHQGGQWNVALMRGDQKGLAEAELKLQQSLHVLKIQLARLSSFDPSSGKTIQTELEGVPEESKLAVQSIIRGNQLEGSREFQQILQRFARIEDALHAASVNQKRLTNAILDKGARRAKTAMHFAMGAIGVGGLLELLLVLFVIRSILQPLQRITTAIRMVNAGELAIELPPITPDEFGDTALALRQFRDRAEKLQRLAYEDPLTGLGNRAQLEESLHAAIQRCRAQSRSLALFYVDLDNFRLVNERLGYRGGDRYLCEAVGRIRRFMPEAGQVFRFSGDKFLVLVDTLPGPASLQAWLKETADSLLRGLSEPYLFGEHLLNMSASIGIALHPGDGDSVEHLLSSAEAAVYAAKKAGRNNARFAAAEFTNQVRKEMALAGDIRRGLEQHEFAMFYQPIVDVRARRVVGAEALLRWQHPSRGWLLPGDFIHVAETEGLINALGEQALRAAHEQLRRWLGRGLRWRVAVNVSARQLQDSRVLRPLTELNQQDPAAARLMDLELTESVLFDNSSATRQTLEEIKRLGYRLGIDDFGTGYSSFTSLQQLPLDKIKIDQQFVATMRTSRAAMAIVSASLALAYALRLEVVAEGVETDDQLQWLLAQGCRLQQGFYFSRALPAAAFEHWVQVFESAPTG